METVAFNAGLLTLLIFIAIWEVIWKGLALWRTARQDKSTWFVLILVLNTVGILPMVYLYFYDDEFGILKKKKVKKSRKK